MILSGDLLKFCDGVRRYGIRGACHGVSCLAAAGGASPGQVFRRVTPGDLALFPGHAQKFGDHTMDVRPGLGAQIAHSGLNVDMAVGFDDEQSVKACSTSRVTAY